MGLKGWGRLALGLALGGGALGTYALVGERPRMRLQPYHLTLRSPQAAGLRLLHLSDQHLGGDSWVQRRRFRRLQALLPRLDVDVVLFTGDFLHDAAGLVALEQLLQLVPAAPLGCYAVLGNHDYALYSYGELFRNAWDNIRHSRRPQQRLAATVQETRRLLRLAWQIYRNERLRFAAVPNPTDELRALLALYNVHLLHNTALPLPDRDIWLVGIDDWVEGQPDVAAALAPVPPQAAIWLLTHNPDAAYQIHDPRIELVLAGHTHGGQIVLPGLGAVHTQSSALSRRHPAGLVTDLPASGPMVVSRGMGESTPLRFRCPPEMVLIELAGPA